MRCLVTGGAGFIGSNLVDALLATGYDVRVLDNFATGDRRNLLHLREHLEIAEGDLRSFERVAAAMRGCELVFHQAALPSVPRSVQDPLTTNDVNVGGTLNVLLAARDAGARRVVYASSSSVYGNAAGDVRREDAPATPLSPYGVSKQAGEGYCMSFHATYGLETVALRYFNVYGPRQNPISEYAAVIPNFITAALAGDRPTVYGDGLQTRDFTFVADVVEANLLAAANSDAAGHVFNIASGSPTSLVDVLAHVGGIADTPLQPLHAPPRLGEVRHSAADVTKAREQLGYRPRTSLDEGLRRTYEFFSGDESLLPRIQEHRTWVGASR